MRQDNNGILALALAVGLIFYLGRDTKARTASARRSVKPVSDEPEVRLLPDPPTTTPADLPRLSIQNFWRVPATAGRSTERGSSG